MKLPGEDVFPNFSLRSVALVRRSGWQSICLWGLGGARVRRALYIRNTFVNNMLQR